MTFRGIFANPGLKILAFALAAIYWFLVSAPRRESTLERAFDVPIALVGIPHDLIITSGVQDTVNVRLRGPLTTLRAQSSQTIEATVDLGGVTKPGETTVPILAQSLNLPPDVQVVAIDPPKIDIRVEPRRQKRVTIREFLVGQLPTGYELGEVVVSPEAALISGPATMIKSTSEVATERIILSGRIQSFQRTVGLVADSPQVQVVEPATADVFVEVISRGTESPGSSTTMGPVNSTSEPR